MVFVTMKSNPMYKRLSFEELIYGAENSHIITQNRTNTRTYAVDDMTDLSSKINMLSMVNLLEEFNQKYTHLRLGDRHKLYRSFKIPKKSGGFRQIDAPNEELMEALRELKDIFVESFGCLYHTTAFAYVNGRCTVDAVKRHQANESMWFAKYDLHNFFGSTTKAFVMKMFSMIFPMSELIKNPIGQVALDEALDLCFLDGGLPQGTPISPTITNIMMIPVDHILANKLGDFNGNKFIYTRYADDFLISSKCSFNCKDVEKLIKDTLQSFCAPFNINEAKTRYGSRNGSNWNLGVMLNRNNDITIGHRKKKQLQTAMFSFMKDKLNGVQWSSGDISELLGNISYAKMVEKETIDRIISSFCRKYGIDIVTLIKDELRNASMA